MKIAVKFLIALGLSLLLVWAVRTFAFTVFTVPAGDLPPQLKAGTRVIVNRIDCDFFNRGDVVVFTDSVFAPAKNQAKVKGQRQAQPQARKFVSGAYFIGRFETLPGETILIDTVKYIIPTVCCKRCGCKDCRFYLLKTPAGQQVVHKHQMIGKAYKLF